MIKKILKNKLARSTGSYLLFNTLDRIIPFVIIPIITRYLTKEEFGTYIVYQAFVAFILPVISLNTDSAILINYYKLDKNNFKSYFFNGIVIFLISLVIFSIAFLSFPSFLSKWLEFPSEWFWAVLLIAGQTYIIRLVLNLWQVEKNPNKYGIYSISQTLSKNLLLLFFVVVLKDGWKGVILSQIIAYTVVFFMGIIILYRRKIIYWNLNKEYLIDNLKVGGPLSVHQIGAWFGNQSNRIIINSLVGTAATGLYGIASVFASIVTVLQNAFNKAFVPYLYEKLKDLDSDSSVKLVKLTYLYNFGLVVFSLVIAFGGILFNDILFGEKYTHAKQFIIWLVLGSAFNGLYKMHVSYIFFTKKTQYVLYITLFTGLLNVLFCYLLIKLNGTVGAAQSYFLTQFLAYLASWYFGNKLIHLPWFKITNYIKK